MGDEPFENRTIDVALLPQVTNINWSPLHARYPFERLLETTLFSLPAIIIATVITVNDSNNPVVHSPYFWVALISMIAAVLAFNLQEARRRAFALREHDVAARKGIVWRTDTLVPFARIQHVESHQGPISRLFGLTSLKIYTAGGHGVDTVIHGLTPDAAQDIKDYILERAALATEAR